MMAELDAILNIVFWALFFVLTAGFFMGVAFYLTWWKKFDTTFISRRIISGRTVINIRKVKIFKDRQGREVTRFRKKLFGFQEWDIPPPEALDIDFKGKIWVEAYYIDGEGFTFIDVPSDKKKKPDPLTLEDKELMINQQEKALKEEGIGFWEKYTPMLIMASAMVLLVVMLMVFWADIASPVLQMGDKLSGVLSRIEVVVDKLDTLINDRQVMRVGFGEINNTVG